MTQLTEKQIEALIRLCDPALHGQSELSRRATAFLEAMLAESMKPKPRRSRSRVRKASRQNPYRLSGQEKPDGVEFVPDDLPDWLAAG